MTGFFLTRLMYMARQADTAVQELTGESTPGHATIAESTRNKQLSTGDSSPRTTRKTFSTQAQAVTTVSPKRAFQHDCIIKCACHNTLHTRCFRHQIQRFHRGFLARQKIKQDLQQYLLDFEQQQLTLVRTVHFPHWQCCITALPATHRCGDIIA